MRLNLAKVTTTAGFLEGKEIEFVRGLNCIIGARGTCKSTIVETIRFALNSDPERLKHLVSGGDTKAEDSAGNSAGMIRATLKGGTVTCEAFTDIGNYTVERDVGSEPRYYQDGVREHSPEGGIQLPIEIYSQGDLQRVADNDDLRLQLIDRPNREQIRTLYLRRTEELNKLRGIGPELKNVRAAIGARRSAVRGLEELRSELRQLRESRPHLPPELDAERAAFLKRKTLFELAQTAKAHCERLVNEMVACTRDFSSLSNASSALQESDLPEAAMVSAHLARAVNVLNRARQAVEQEQQQQHTISESVRAFAQAVEVRNESYYALRKEQTVLNESLKKEDLLRQQIQRLERAQAELDDLLEQERSIQARRQSARGSAVALSDQIFEIRMKEVDAINSEHSENIMLSLQHGGRSSDYAQEISSMLAGSRLRNQEEVAREIAARVAPGDLVDIVESGDAKRLSQVLGREPAQGARLISYLSDHPQLHELESVVFEDRLDITMYDGDTPKPVSSLSKGQKATALLPLILRDAEYPLIMDQPEDDLDNRFIYGTLVERVRALKRTRQLIFVTHNANIPVLGAADRVIVMQMDTPTRAAMPSVGTVDERKEDVLTLLEGGAEAFRRRHDHYAPILASDVRSNPDFV